MDGGSSSSVSPSPIGACLFFVAIGKKKKKIKADLDPCQHVWISPAGIYFPSIQSRSKGQKQTKTLLVTKAQSADTSK